MTSFKSQNIHCIKQEYFDDDEVFNKKQTAIKQKSFAKNILIKQEIAVKKKSYINMKCIIHFESKVYTNCLFKTEQKKIKSCKSVIKQAR